MSNGHRIAAVYRRPLWESGRLPCIVINHGYSGHKEEYDDLAAALNEAGFASLQFDSRGCGESEAPLGRMMCSTEWVEDSDAAVTWASAQPGVDRDRIGFTGCSLGGVMALHAAAHDRRIRSVVEMSAFSDGFLQLQETWTARRGAQAWQNFLSELELDAQRVVRGERSRMIAVPDALAMVNEDRDAYMKDRLGRPGIVTEVPLESVRSGFLNLRPVLWLGGIAVPVTVMHGDADLIVLPCHGDIIYGALKGQKEQVVIPGAPHPLPMYDGRAQVFAHIARWFNQTL
jgi:alpha-beta hydrolase superfamily lysophospholipase